jgi:hypothetical protein
MRKTITLITLIISLNAWSQQHQVPFSESPIINMAAGLMEKHGAEVEYSQDKLNAMYVGALKETAIYTPVQVADIQETISIARSKVSSIHEN